MSPCISQPDNARIRRDGQKSVRCCPCRRCTLSRKTPDHTKQVRQSRRLAVCWRCLSHRRDAYGMSRCCPQRWFSPSHQCQQSRRLSSRCSRPMCGAPRRVRLCRLLWRLSHHRKSGACFFLLLTRGGYCRSHPHKAGRRCSLSASPARCPSRQKGRLSLSNICKQVQTLFLRRRRALCCNKSCRRPIYQG